MGCEPLHALLAPTPSTAFGFQLSLPGTGTGPHPLKLQQHWGRSILSGPAQKTIAELVCLDRIDRSIDVQGSTVFENNDWLADNRNQG